MRNAASFLLLFMCVGFVLRGCAASPRGVHTDPVVANPSIVEGDFDDVDAVVAGIIPLYRLVAFGVHSDRPEARLYELRTLSDEPGTLLFEDLGDGRIRISCDIGRFAETAREEELLRALAHRFTQLRGDVAVPVSDP